MRRLALMLGLLLALPASANAATPASGTASDGSPAAWSGQVTAGYASYAAFVLADAGGASSSVPCLPVSCDSFALTINADGPRKLNVLATSTVARTVTVRISGPDGLYRYDNGFSEGPDTEIVIPSAPPGDYRVDVTTSNAGAAPYTATATLATADASDPTYSRFTYEKVRIPMSDGVKLSAEIWRPVVPEGVKVPVILHLTPYHALSPGHTPDALPALVDGVEQVARGYAFAFVDVRGTWASGGCWDYGGPKEISDGNEVATYLGTRLWSNGNVGMLGVSYPGTTPNAAAVSAEPSPHLKTIVPISGISRWWGYAYQQGVRATTSGENADFDPPGVTPPDFMFGYGFLPPPDPEALLDPGNTAMRWDVCGRDEKLLKAYDTDPDYDAFWRARDYLGRAHRVKVPVLLSHGQRDFNVKTWEGTDFWQAVDVPKMLVLGQWAHAYPGTYWEGWQPILNDWLDRWLRDEPNGIENRPRVHVQTNDGTWHEQADWGRTATAEREFALEGSDFTYLDDGALTESEVLRSVGEGVRWARVPVTGTEGPLRFGGRPVLRLRATSDQPGTHFTAVLHDVAPDGTTQLISRAFLNARYRGGLAEGRDLEPGTEYMFPLEFIDKDYVVADGHHLELRVASSSATWVASDPRRATNTLDLAGSDLVLPLYPQFADRGAAADPPLPAAGLGPNDSPGDATKRKKPKRPRR